MFKPCVLFPRPLFTGKIVFSEILPPLNFRDRKVPLSKTDLNVEIKRGELLEGQLKASNIGPTSGGVLHDIYAAYGPSKIYLLLYQMRKTALGFFNIRSSALTISDFILTTQLTKKTSTILSNIKLYNKYKIAAKFRETNYLNYDFNESDSFGEELTIRNRSLLSQLARAIYALNNIKLFILSGTKGNLTSISQILFQVTIFPHQKRRRLTLPVNLELI